ncbi:MAG: hypothetical protein KIT80_18585 [Chitinophagaceae bacterium]|nr:hypothetical protein [Chitinophagaceae bacterium]MCW5928934.1 hypothetical protein [Chitinophagaceae bacterium]
MCKVVSILSLLLVFNMHLRAQTVLSEGTIVYFTTVQTGSKEPQLADMFDGVTTTIFLRGNQSRTEMVTPLGTTVTLQNNATGTGAVLKEFGNQKIMIQMNRNDWQEMNKKYEGIVFVDQPGDTKKIAGYECKKATAKLKDGSSFTVYYTTELISENKDYDYQFKNLPGFPLEYESSVGNYKVRYTASRISFDPVPVQKFALPKSGYRQLTFEESKNLQKEN